jgi:DNA-binding NarL/FixJ family response regulator
VRAVRVVAAGDSLLAPQVTSRLIEAFCQQPTTPLAPPAALEELTPREREVLGLVARGLSNDEIAQRLIVSRGTVKTHVERILMKLGLRDRIQGVVLAYETGVVRPGRADQANPT